MKQKIEIEELIAAAQRHEADKRRQAKLADLIDQMAASDTGVQSDAPFNNKKQSHRKVLTWLSIAASIMIVFSVGLAVITTDKKPIDSGATTAEVKIDTIKQIEILNIDTQKETKPSKKQVTTMQTTPNRQATVVAEILKPDKVEIDEQPESIISETQQKSAPLLAENSIEVQEQPADVKDIVKERTSTRLVKKGKTTTNQGRPSSMKSPSSNDTPLLAFNDQCGTGTSVDIKKWDL